MTFTTLIFGLCAYILAYGEQNLAHIGYISQGQCIAHLGLGEIKKGEFVSFGEHSISLQWLEDGDADVGVDDHHFVVIRGIRA